MISYFVGHVSLFLDAFLEHIRLVGITLLISICLAAGLTILLYRSQRAGNYLIQVFSGIYAIPSLALFAILIPVTGLGNKTAIIVLCVYNQYLLLRNILTGIQNVEPKIVEAGVGMGMSSSQVFRKIQIPLAMPSIVAGIRLAIISTTGIATIAASINAGGLGTVLFSGMRTSNLYKILWGTILSVVIAFVVDTVLKGLEKRLTTRNAGV